MKNLKLDYKKVLGRGRPVDLTGVFVAQHWYEEPSRWAFWKKYGPIGVLIGSNVATIVVGLAFWGLFQSSVQLNVWLSESKVREVERLATIKNEQSERIASMEQQVDRFVEFQNSSPADIVRIGKVVARILATSSGSQREFLEAALPHAIRLQVAENIPASAVLGMAIYESGYGRSSLAKEHYNYFGMKAFGDWKGPRAASMTTRDSGVTTRADFRSYSSVYEGFLGFCQFLKRADRYDAAFREVSGERFVSRVLQAGYCPDSDYLDAVRKIMARHRLQELETLLEDGKEEKRPSRGSFWQ